MRGSSQGTPGRQPPVGVLVMVWTAACRWTVAASASHCTSTTLDRWVAVADRASVRFTEHSHRPQASAMSVVVEVEPQRVRDVQLAMGLQYALWKQVYMAAF